MNFISTKAKLSSRKVLTENMLEIKMELAETIDYQPGQFANVSVAEKTWRSYSIVDLKDKTLQLLIDTKPQGPGSLFFQDSQIATETEVMIPMGGFVVRESEKKLLFVATGTGLAPFVPMLKSILESNPLREIVMLVGVRHDQEYFVDRYFDFSKNPNVKVIPCITKGEGAVPNSVQKRVTEVLPELGLNLPEYDAYICGNPKMVVDVMRYVKENGVEKIYTEKY